MNEGKKTVTGERSAARYVRVKVGNARFILKNPHNVVLLGTECVTGTSVDIEGVNIAGKGASSQTRIIDLSLIDSITALKMDNFYGHLVASKL